MISSAIQIHFLAATKNRAKDRSWYFNNQYQDHSNENCD